MKRIQWKNEIITGIKKGLSSFIWMVEIIVPISFLMTILQWTGWLDHVNQVMQPVMSFINLPPQAAIPIIAGMVINIYAAIGILSILPFSIEQLTLIGIFLLVAHNMIIETIIQHRSGINFIKAILIRLITAVVLVFIVSQYFDNTAQNIPVQPGLGTEPNFLTVLSSWSLSTFILLIKILGIIMFIMILLQISKSAGWIDRLNRVVRPVMRVLGLAPSMATSYIAGIVFGLMYGGAVIIEEGKKENISRQEMQYLHASLGINHSMIEDPLLFVMLGANLLWLWIPRLIMAVLVVQGYRLLKNWSRKLIPGVSRNSTT